jgi:hypothetical protein
MSIVAYIPLLVALIGLVVFFWSKGPASKPGLAGIVAFGCGLLPFLFFVANEKAHFGI